MRTMEPAFKKDQFFRRRRHRFCYCCCYFLHYFFLRSSFIWLLHSFYRLFVSSFSIIEKQFLSLFAVAIPFVVLIVRAAQTKPQNIFTKLLMLMSFVLTIRLSFVRAPFGIGRLLLCHYSVCLFKNSV